MCLSVPARVVAVDEIGAAVEAEGRLQRVLTALVPDARVGEWVLVSAGAMVQRLDPESARLMSEALAEERRLVMEEAARERSVVG